MTKRHDMAQFDSDFLDSVQELSISDLIEEPGGVAPAAPHDDDDEDGEDDDEGTEVGVPTIVRILAELRARPTPLVDNTGTLTAAQPPQQRKQAADGPKPRKPSRELARWTAEPAATNVPAATDSAMRRNALRALLAAMAIGAAALLVVTVAWMAFR